MNALFEREAKGGEVVLKPQARVVGDIRNGRPCLAAG